MRTCANNVYSASAHCYTNTIKHFVTTEDPGVPVGRLETQHPLHVDSTGFLVSPVLLIAVMTRHC